MRYALFVYDAANALDPLTTEQRQMVYDEYVALAEMPGLVGHRLQPPDTATTLRITDGRRVVTTQPADGAKQHLAGFYLLDTDNADQALEIAARIPAARLGGAIHVQALVTER